MALVLQGYMTTTRHRGGGRVGGAAGRGGVGQDARGGERGTRLAQGRWEPGLRGVNWRVGLATASSRGGTSNTPVALVELELGRNGQVRTVTMGDLPDLGFRIEIIFLKRTFLPRCRRFTF